MVVLFLICNHFNALLLHFKGLFGVKDRLHWPQQLIPRGFICTAKHFPLYFAQVRTSFWKASQNLKTSSSWFGCLQSKCPNHEKDLFKLLVLLRKSELYLKLSETTNLELSWIFIVSPFDLFYTYARTKIGHYWKIERHIVADIHIDCRSGYILCFYLAVGIGYPVGKTHRIWTL